MTVHIVVTAPIRLHSLVNEGGHWRVRARRAKDQRWAARLALNLFSKPTHQPLDIVITRIAPRKLDTDNLAISAKHVRDGVADWLNVDDGHPLLLWIYEQEKGAPGYYGCRISIRSKD
jgi:hypothetical protein